jgi:hypothetical protein
MKFTKPHVMNKLLVIIAFMIFAAPAFSQTEKDSDHIQTLFREGAIRSSGGYAAISNKMTSLDGQFANMVEMYGGWYINHRLLLGIGGNAVTNDIVVPDQFKVDPTVDLSYMYSQFGLVTEYVIGSNRTVHLVANAMTGAGFTLQYQRNLYHENRNYRNIGLDENWFFVVEPGVQLEINLFKWMRFSPGYSYRFVHGSSAAGLRDSDLSGSSLNLTLKFGRF